MSRLTYKEPNGRWGIVGMNSENMEQKMYVVATKLKDYEDTGLSPAEISALIDRTSWVPVKYGLPEDSDATYLVQVSGTYNNITFEHAQQLAVYDHETGKWILDGYPDAVVTVEAWMPAIGGFKE